MSGKVSMHIARARAALHGEPKVAEHNAWCSLFLGGLTCNCDAFLKRKPLASVTPTKLIEFYDLKFKGWNCRSCRVFNGEEKETQISCRNPMCNAPRPTTPTP